MIHLPLLGTMDILWAANLCYKAAIDVIFAGVWPGNREWQGLLLSDVLELEVEFALQGWGKELANAYAVEIPPTPEGQEWREVNQRLWDENEGFLAPTNKDDLTICTLRGSHTTASIRNIKLGAKCNDERITTNGRIATETILEKNPSLKEPCKGIEYVIVRHEIASAMPEIVEAICRAGNSDHGTQRKASLINVWRRMFQVLIMHPSLTDTQLVSRAAKGLSSELTQEAAFLPKLVRVWSGGQDAKVLRDLELFEKVSSQKRNLKGAELKMFADLTAVSRLKAWVPACIKACMKCPKEYLQKGLFSHADISKLSREAKDLMPEVLKGTEEMQSAREYVEAHCLGKVEKRIAYEVLGQLDQIRFLLQNRPALPLIISIIIDHHQQHRS